MTQELGIHEKVELLGQSFDIQTELVDLDTETVRTVIFLLGQVAAHRERRLSETYEGSKDDLETRVRNHHRNALEQFVRRTLGFEARSAGAELEIESLPVTSLRDAEKAPEMPPIPEDPALADTIEVRLLVARLLVRLDLAPTVSEHHDTEPQGWRDWIGHLGRRLGAGSKDSSVSTRLEKARLALSWAVEQPGFRRVP